MMINNNFNVISNITDNHLFLLNVSINGINGKEAEYYLYKCNIIVNKNMIPNDKKHPQMTSGIRIGTPSITTRGFDLKQIKIVSNFINDIIRCHGNNLLLKKIKMDVIELCKKFPIYE